MSAMLGSIQSGTIAGTMQSEGSVVGTIVQAVHSIVGTITMPAEYSEYKGDYRVVPSFDEQVLHTNSLVLKDDVVVEPISIKRVSNSSGGKTIIIGG